MSDMPKHSRGEAMPAQRSGIFAAWAVLLGMGGTGVTFNIVHAVTTGHMLPALALLYGIAPVFAAMGISHLVAVHEGGWVMKAITFAVMLGAMTLSIGATASVVAPTSGHLRWLFGAVLDAAALLALRVILDGRSRKAAEATALGTAQATAVEASAKAAAMESDLATARAELAGTQAALEAERQRTSARKPRRSSGRKPTRKPATASAPAPAGTSAPEVGDTADLGTEAEALRILSEEPGISGSQLGLRLGKSDRYGRDLMKRLAASNAEG